jgi:Zn-dependent M28 family amino/carboxypeptidase
MKLRITCLLLSTAALPLMAGAASANTAACASRVNNTAAKLMQCVTLEGVRQHQAALQTAADENFGIRTSGTPGYDASVAYVVETLEAAGYTPEVQEFQFNAFIELQPSVLEQTAPNAVTYVEGTDFAVMSQSDAGEVTAEVTAVDINLAPPRASDSGCEAADFAGFPEGNIALVQRGTCSFEQKAANASAAGATGVIIFNQGNDPSREGLINGTAGNTNTSGIPILEATFALGEELANTPGAVVHMDVNVFRGEATTYNVLAETSGNANNVVMVGAHLDSVNEGPGIQDNGTGSAAILEVAVQMAKVAPRNKVRFAWWGAEESGLVGSDYYVLESLTDEERAQIALYLNFDMIGSPNYVRKIYDGDGSSFGLAGPAGSAQIERFFEKFYEKRNLAYEATEISFRSDYAAFFDSGIPFGGLFTGAEEIKTPEQAAIYGGTAGEQLDPCYHEACDTFDNISLEVLDLNSDAAAAAVLQYAMNTEAINGVRGKGNFKTRESSEDLGMHKAR